MSHLPHIDVGVRPEADRPRRRAPLVLAGILAGVVLAVVWSFELVDGVIGDNVANSLLGYEAKEASIASTSAGLVFAFITGLAGTFTACNIAVFGALPKLADAQRPGRGAVGAVIGALGWFTLGLLVVSISYGVIGVLLGERLPQLSTDMIGEVPVRLLQSSVVFGLIGLAFAYLGLAALRVVPDPFAHRPRLRLAVLGGLVGGFLVGRPYPLFRRLFEHAVDTGNPFYGALAFLLQSVGNVLLVAVLAVLVVALSRGAALRWLSENPARASAIAGVALLALGVFMVVYWDVRVPAMFGFGWFPTMPWN